MPDDTLPNRPGAMSSRPRTGLAAWEATVGYIASEHSPDALLTLRAYPVGEENRWSALLEWGPHREEVAAMDGLPSALRELWTQVNEGHIIFQTTADAIRKPAGYGEFDWIDADTRDSLERLMWVVRVVFKEDWTLVMIYQPTDNPSVRVQMRLIARDDGVYISGRGPSLKDASAQLYRNATPYLSGTKDCFTQGERNLWHRYQPIFSASTTFAVLLWATTRRLRQNWQHWWVKRWAPTCRSSSAQSACSSAATTAFHRQH